MGDLELRFLPNDFSPNLRQREEAKMIRLGFHHAFSPGSDLIASVMYQDGDFKLHDSLSALPFGIDIIDIKAEQDSSGGELQYLYCSERLSMLGGAGFFYINGDTTLATKLSFAPGGSPIFASSIEERMIRHTNVYLYSQINYLKHVTFTVAASADLFRGGLEDRSQFNPKLGITWNPFSATTFRAALFRTFNRTLINSQTIEPTQIAGFNQFYNDFEGTNAWRYGIALDQKFSKSIYGGAEFSLRDLKFPYTSVSASGLLVRKEKWHERMGRAYAYWTPHKWFGLSAEYLYERFIREEIALGLKQIETHRVPLGINFYHPSGLSAMLMGTYINQMGRFEREGSLGTFLHGDDQFYLFDASVSYRLPKRFGYISLEGKNLFNRSFHHQDTDPINPQVRPKRVIYGKLTLVF
jgi:outer membrane receptor protein involved in Fe transport